MPPALLPGDAVALTRALVAIDSRNPSLAAVGPGEGACARFLERVLHDWGFRVELQHVAPGRPNVLARIGDTGGPSLLLNGHLDTVGTEGMVHEPWDPVARDGRIYGRGSADMKAGIAAMCAAAWRAAHSTPGGLRGEVIVTAVVDEESHSIGTKAVVDGGVRADAAIVAEPTRLAVCTAHKGFAWADLTVHGTSAHGSRYDTGVDAITLAAMVIVELDAWQQRELTQRAHPLLGRPSLHASMIAGGTELSTYPGECAVQLERRTIPGEAAAGFGAEIEGAVARVRALHPELSATVTPGFSQPPNEVPAAHAIAQCVVAALTARGRPAPIEGLSCWTDAAILSAAGIPAICFGPGDICAAHSSEESVSIAEIEEASAVLESAIISWCGAH
ncbi:MAG: ArgE/DapE family deacylase [Gemmatimonadaceae bacterium]|nr:ArgE/DapE family deacylase [Gemmatimonadaceae bacterium]